MARFGFAFATPGCQLTIPYTDPLQPNGKHYKSTLAVGLTQGSDAGPWLIQHFGEKTPLWGEVVAWGTENPHPHLDFFSWRPLPFAGPGSAGSRRPGRLEAQQFCREVQVTRIPLGRLVVAMRTES